MPFPDMYDSTFDEICCAAINAGVPEYMSEILGFRNISEEDIVHFFIENLEFFGFESDSFSK